MVRVDVTDRYYRVFTYQDVDRVPDIEFGYWPQTIRRWLGEGLPAEHAGEGRLMSSRKLDAFFGFEPEGHGIALRLGMNPAFSEEVLEERDGSVVARDASGVVAERFLAESDECSIPRFLEFPISTPAHWQRMKGRYLFDDPIRAIPPEEIAQARAAADAGKMITVAPAGFYGQLRSWMGFEGLSVAFYDYPEMIHEMVDHWSELIVRQIERLGQDLPIDQVAWWEDMAGKNGPFVGPEMFAEFFQGGYRKVMSAAKARGCALGVVDCDGNPHDIVGNWLAEGVNIMFPMEVAAGCDPLAWRAEFGKDLRMLGGIAKFALAAGPEAIDAELERVKPMLDAGGAIPHLDHRVPPDISYDNYRYYLDKKRQMIGK